MTTIQSQDDLSETIIFTDEPLKNKLLRNGFWLYFFSFLVAPAGYLIKMLISRSISVEEVGVVYSIIGFMTIISTYHDLGLTESLQYYLPHYLIDKEYNKAKTILVITRIVQLITGIAIGGCIFYLAPRLSQHYFHSSTATSLLRLFCFYLLFINLFQVLQSIFVATQQVKRYNGIDVVRMRSICLFVILLFTVNSLTAINFVISRILGLLLGIVVALFVFRKKFGRLMRKGHIVFNKGIMRKQRKYAFRVMLGINAATIQGQIDQQFAVFYLGPAAAGYRSNYLSLQAVVTTFTAPLLLYLFPLFNELEKKRQHDKSKLLKKYIYLGFLGFGLIVAVIAGIRGQSIAILLFGETFKMSGTLFSIAAPFLWLPMLIGINFQYLAGKGLVKQRVMALVFGILITMLINVYIINIYGLRGILYAQIIGRFITFLASQIYIKVYIKP